jgi:hypothetical protein
MPRLTSAVSINAAGQLVATQGYELSALLASGKWLTMADVLALLGGGGTEPFIRWSAGQCIIAPVANPLDAPCVYFQRIYIPAPFLLDRFQYGLIAPGTANDGALWVNLFTEVAGAPAAEYTDARCVALHDGLPAGAVDLYCGTGVDFDIHKTVALPTGWVWAGIDVDTDSSAGINQPGVDYWDAGEVQAVGRGGRKTVGFGGGFAELTDFDITPPFRASPAIHLGGTFL